MPMLRRLATGLTALTILLAALVGVPWLLLRIGGTPSLTGWDRILDTILIQDTTGRLFVTALIGAAWLAWAGFVLSLLLELLGQARSATVPRLRIIAPQQHLARVLIAAILAMTAAPALHTVSSAPASATGTVTSARQQPPRTRTPQPPSRRPPPTPPRPVHQQHRPASTSPSTPATTYGTSPSSTSGTGAPGKPSPTPTTNATQPDGRHLGPDHVLQPGWTLLIPGAPTTSDGSQILTVHRGDTLSRIAQHRLGHADDWPQLQRPDHPGANPDQLIPGEHILIPASPDRAGARGPRHRRLPPRRRHRRPRPPPPPPQTPARPVPQRHHGLNRRRRRRPPQRPRPPPSPKAKTPPPAPSATSDCCWPAD